MNDIIDDTIFESDRDIVKTSSGSFIIPLSINLGDFQQKKRLPYPCSVAVWYPREIAPQEVAIDRFEIKKSSYAVSLENRIKELPFVEGEDLADAGINPPNRSALNTAARILSELIKHGLVPDFVTSSAQGGVSFTFNNKKDERLYLETYNSGETGFIVENYKQKKIIENKDLTSLESLVELKDYFSYELPRVSKNW